MKKEIIDRKPFSANPADSYLSIVLCRNPISRLSPFVTWVHNSQTDDYFDGHYHKDLHAASKDFKTRGEMP